MLVGVSFTQLGNGDPLINKNWSYKNLWGIYASKQKLLDAFSYADDIGFGIIYETIDIKLDVNGNPTLDNTGANSDIWPLYDSVNHNDRISFYKQNINGKFQFICQLNFPENLNSTNMQKYCDFFISLIKNDSFSWIQNWQIGDTPEELIYNSSTGKSSPKIAPADYVLFLNRIRTDAKLFNPNLNIGGPGIYKCLGLLDPNNFLYSDNSFYHNWLKEAIDAGLLYNIDFFTTQIKQETKGLEYDEVFSLTLLLKELINERLTNAIPIYSINQGRQELNSDLSHQLDQAYYNISELLNVAKNGIIPIQYCMFDPCDNLSLNPEYNSKNDGYGICRYDMSKKPQYDYFKFAINNLKDYNALTFPNKIYNDDDVDNISFISGDKKDIISIVWAKNKINKTVVILPNPDEFYLSMDNKRVKIINPYEWATDGDFLIVTQHLNIDLLEYDDIKDSVFKKFMYNINFRDSLLNSVPVNYNTTTDDTNFYKILRAVSLELADAQIQVDTLTDNAYLNTAHKEAIYQNFGSMVDLEKQSEWDYEKYRRLIQGVFKSLLTGPTLASITEAINLFINYDSIYGGDVKIADIKIHELYNEKNLDPAIYDNIYPQFAFVVEVNKNIDVDIDQYALNRDLKYIINILKPAHTLSFIIIILSGTENYRQWYYDHHFGPDGLNIEFKDSDKVIMEGTIGGANGKKEGIYGWKHHNYSGVFHTFSKDNPTNSKLNGPILIGPRYTIYEKMHQDILLQSNEDVDIQDNIFIEPAEIIRYGYYKDDQDSLDDPKRDNPVPLTNRLGQPNPDYNNPDSGEYYKNWWLKYKQLVVDNNNTVNKNGINILENAQYKIDTITDTTKFHTDVQFENTVYPDKPITYQKLPLIFQTNTTQLPGEQLLDFNQDVAYDIKYYTAQVGGPVKREDGLPPELKYNGRSIIIGPSTHEVELGNFPYNNIVERPFRIEPLINKNFYFENMDLSENFMFDSDTGNGLRELYPMKTKPNADSLAEGNIDSINDGSLSENYRIDIISKMGQQIDREMTATEEQYGNIDDQVTEYGPENQPEFKFGYNPFIFTTNNTILPISMTADGQPTDIQKPLGFGCSIRDTDITMELYQIVNGNKVVIVPATSYI